MKLLGKGCSATCYLTDDGVVVKEGRVTSNEFAMQKLFWDRGLAPEPLAFDFVSSGADRLTMEYLADYVPVAKASYIRDEDVLYLLKAQLALAKEGIYHGDVHSDNVLVAKPRTKLSPKLIDFGYAGVTHEDDWYVANSVLDFVRCVVKKRSKTKLGLELVQIARAPSTREAYEAIAKFVETNYA